MTDEKEVATETNGQEKNENLEEPTDLENAIIRQVEYYFGDLNLPRDKFMREQVQLDEGWVPLEILMRFNRLAKLTTDPEVVAKAISKSSSGLLEVSDDNKKIRRSPEIPIPEMNEERRKELMDRSIYAKGFDKDATLDELLKYFKDFEVVENVIMRKYLDRSSKLRMFKGSVFATFKTKEQAEKFVATKGLKYNDKDLLVMSQEKYLQSKQEEYTAKKDLKEKKQKQKEAEKEDDKDDFKLPTGTVLHFSNASTKTKREDLRDALTSLGGEVAYVDFKLGDTQGWVRLTAENSAKDLFEKITDGKLKIGDNEIAFRILECDEEKTYLDKTVEEMAKKRKNMKTNKHGKGKHGNFKGRHGKKRKQGDNDSSHGKRAKTNDS